MSTLAELIAHHAEVPLVEAIEMLESPPMAALKRVLYGHEFDRDPAVPMAVRMWINGEPQRLNPPDTYPPEQCGSFEQPPLPAEYLPQPR